MPLLVHYFCGSTLYKQPCFSNIQPMLICRDLVFYSTLYYIPVQLVCGVTIIALASFALTEKSLTHHNIDKILEVLDWHNLGTKLGLPDYKLKEISTGTVQQRQMISKWLAYDTEASWNKLAKALKEMEMHVIAKEVLDKYVPTYEGTFA